MIDDLKIIKKKYGEKMMQLCQSLFPVILNKNGELSNIFLQKFEPNKNLYDDIINNCLLNEFRRYVSSLSLTLDNTVINVDKSPKDLLGEAGYDFFECHTKEEVDSFKTYFTYDEELCTFADDRLQRSYVFFAVKKNVSDIVRRNIPVRQDEYGTSVISIQFTKDDNNFLFITNRYNHSVKNPNATFDGNLDNIIPGLTNAFKNTYGLYEKIEKNVNFIIPGYVCINGKYYKYNYSLNNIYYCPNNIIIDNGEAKRFDHEKYIIMDYFIINLVDKTIELYDNSLLDSFAEEFKSINNIYIKNTTNKEKEVLLYYDDNKVVYFLLDKFNNLKKLINNNIKIIDHNYLNYNLYLREIELNQVKEIGNDFLYLNEELNNVILDSVLNIGDGFLYSNKGLSKLSLPNVLKIRNYFLHRNKELKDFFAPKLLVVGNKFLFSNIKLDKLDLPSLNALGDYFLYRNTNLFFASIPNCAKISSHFMYSNKILSNLHCEKVIEIGDYFLFNNLNLRTIDLSFVKNIGNCFLCKNFELKDINIVNVKKIGNNFMNKNKMIRIINVSDDAEIGKNFLPENSDVQVVNQIKGDSVIR